MSFKCLDCDRKLAASSQGRGQATYATPTPGFLSRQPVVIPSAILLLGIASYALGFMSNVSPTTPASWTKASALVMTTASIDPQLQQKASGKLVRSTTRGAWDSLQTGFLSVRLAFLAFDHQVIPPPQLITSLRSPSQQMPVRDPDTFAYVSAPPLSTAVLASGSLLTFYITPSTTGPSLRVEPPATKHKVFLNDFSRPRTSCSCNFPRPFHQHHAASKKPENLEWKILSLSSKKGITIELQGEEAFSCIDNRGQGHIQPQRARSSSQTLSDVGQTLYELGHAHVLDAGQGPPIAPFSLVFRCRWVSIKLSSSLVSNRSLVVRRPDMRAGAYRAFHGALPLPRSLLWHDSTIGVGFAAKTIYVFEGRRINGEGGMLMRVPCSPSENEDSQSKSAGGKQLEFVHIIPTRALEAYFYAKCRLDAIHRTTGRGRSDLEILEGDDGRGGGVLVLRRRNARFLTNSPKSRRFQGHSDTLDPSKTLRIANYFSIPVSLGSKVADASDGSLIRSLFRSRYFNIRFRGFGYLRASKIKYINTRWNALIAIGFHGNMNRLKYTASRSHTESYFQMKGYGRTNGISDRICSETSSSISADLKAGGKYWRKRTPPKANSVQNSPNKPGSRQQKSEPKGKTPKRGQKTPKTRTQGGKGGPRAEPQQPGKTKQPNPELGAHGQSARKVVTLKNISLQDVVDQFDFHFLEKKKTRAAYVLLESGAFPEPRPR
ncbi:hypothetical protein M407DRAFT_216348 [Tulasnella calospora MUT 4182]|uniref:Uncharacterized protein n=1 Tax=Tulasnella calospora MUT 4182 TaxID=1051891 RepID=A0A0C3QBJ0_9AGAM|nr:hypothetical protein M407DRAFT_216348 [Tulasnella calospora MUT 4182]